MRTYKNWFFTKNEFIKKAGPIPAFFLSVTYRYSTVTDLAKFLGWSTLQPRITAM